MHLVGTAAASVYGFTFKKRSFWNGPNFHLDSHNHIPVDLFSTNNRHKNNFFCIDILCLYYDYEKKLDRPFYQ